MRHLFYLNIIIMKKLLTFAALLAVVAFTSCKYDDDDIWNSVHGLENRIAKLEELCKQMNTNISSLQTIVTALQNNDYVTGTTPLMKDGKEIGYTITFSKGNPITIYHGKDGQDGEDGTNGKDGTTPAIGVKQDADGVYYWTLNGDWLTDENGDKIKAEGTDGKDGADGTNGTDGVTPKLEIREGYWWISYDNGTNWTQLGKATGEDGKDGEDGIGGDSMFTKVDYKTSTDYVTFTLADGTQIKLPTWSAFEALQRLCNETNTNLSALQTIVTALQNNDYITSVDPLTENGKVVGYTIKFAKSNPIVIYNGKDGADGVDGNTPVIGVKKDGDGIYYWTLDGEFIIVDGQKIKAQGADGSDGSDGADGNNGQDGTNGKDGVTPKLEIRDGYWYISYDNGTNWTQLGKATGEDGKDGEDGIGDDIFKSITQDDNNVYFALNDDNNTVITISKVNSASLSLSIDCTDNEVFEYNETRTFAVTQTNIKEISIVCVNGWKALITNTNLSITAPQYTNYTGEEKGDISIIATGEDGHVVICKVKVQIQSVYVKIPDDAFREYCLSNFDTNRDNKLSKEEAAGVNEIVSKSNNESWSSFDGIEYFTGLKKFHCNGSRATDLDLSNCRQLEYVQCGSGNLSSLNIKNCKELTYLACGFNNLSNLDISDNPKLTYLSCQNNKLTNLDLSIQLNLQKVICTNNAIDKIIVHANTSFTPEATQFMQIDKDVTAKVYRETEVVKYAIGDYNSGIIFRITNDGLSGKIMAIDLYGSRWSTISTTPMDAIDLDNGFINTQKIMSIPDWQTLYPAFNICVSKGANWYIPAKNELMELYNKKEIINASLSAIGESPLFESRYDKYWSSTTSSNRVFRLEWDGFTIPSLGFIYKEVGANDTNTTYVISISSF